MAEADAKAELIGAVIGFVQMGQFGGEPRRGVGGQGCGPIKIELEPVIHAAVSGADIGNPAFDTEAFGAAQQVAVHPCGRKVEPFEAGDFAAKAEVAGLFFDHGDGGAQKIDRGDAFVFGNGDRGEGAGAAQAVFGAVDFGGVKGFALGQARNLADAVFARALLADDIDRAEAQARAGVERDARREGAVGVIGDHVLPGDAGFGIALRAPAIDTGGDGLADGAALRGLAGGKAIGQFGIGCQRGDGGLGKAELRAGIDADLNLRDPLRGIQGGDIRRLAPVEEDGDDGGVVALGIKRADQAAIFGAGGGQHLIGLILFVFQRQKGGSGAQCIVQIARRAGDGELHAVECMAGVAQRERACEAEHEGQAGQDVSALCHGNLTDDCCNYRNRRRDVQSTACPPDGLAHHILRAVECRAENTLRPMSCDITGGLLRGDVAICGEKAFADV